LGQQVQYELDEVLGLSDHGEVRHLTEAMGTDGAMVIRIGIEAGIKRLPYKFKKFGSREWNDRKLYQQDISLQTGRKIISKAISFTNKKGQKIAALINTTGNFKTAPVIILPPAFGKKKETLSPLVSTLLANFHHFNQDLITIRYDGINRPGESYNQEGRAKRGYEMLHYRISQGLDDLETTLDYVYDNPHFKPAKVILITFSMSALDARRLLARQQEQRLDFWISVMGLTSAQGALSNVLGGMDIIGNYKMNIPNGINGMLGHLVDMDNLAEDLIANKYAFITDARLDMSKISIPVLWIYGAHDKWLDINEIRDIMSIKTDGERQIIEVPTGHNLHSSDDAVKAFQVITSAVYRNLNNREVEAVDPDKEEMLRLITYERERILQVQDLKVEDYWKEYLIGSTNNSYGYDFYGNIKDFRDFLSLEVNLLNPANDDHIADMGCGTGLLIDNMLHNLARQQRPIKTLNITAVDLIPEALEKTKEKYEKLCNSHNFLRDYKLEYIEMNLEPNRLIPVKEFLADTTLDLEFLRGRVEGLKNRTLDQLINKRSKKLLALLRGALPSKSQFEQLKKLLTAEEYGTVIDFNRAARFLKRELTYSDLKTPALKMHGKTSVTPLDTRQYSNLCTGDLCFKNLNFDNHGLKVNLDFPDQLFSKIAASLFISYIFNPDYLMNEFFRILQPGGTLLVSSMKPDSDISIIFTDYIKKIRNLDLQDTEIKSPDLNLNGARLMLNEAAALFELEEEGYFKFNNEEELILLLAEAGFTDIMVNNSLGNPPQAIIVTGIKRDDSG
jgi:ubiquinone/menaquinone biosynthesis C-methylase UbiE/pimeloyl-ACP methyl ester carboxylesterase